jgi:hypothetical protein
VGFGGAAGAPKIQEKNKRLVFERKKKGSSGGDCC